MINLSELDVFFSVNSFAEDELRGKTVVVIDVLRASSTIVTALYHGAKGVIPVGDMAEASKISQNVDSDNYLLCGEKDGVVIEGYDLGNSPLEYTTKVVKGKTLIFNTTNGTKAIKKSTGAENIYVASFLNLNRVLDELNNEKNDVVLVCAGWKGRLALEDMLLAGNLIHKLSAGTLGAESKDGAKIAFGLFEKYGDNILDIVKHSNHAVRLREIVGEEDVNYCCQMNTCHILPTLHEGIITIKE